MLFKFRLVTPVEALGYIVADSLLEAIEKAKYLWLRDYHRVRGVWINRLDNATIEWHGGFVRLRAFGPTLEVVSDGLAQMAST